MGKPEGGRRRRSDKQRAIRDQVEAPVASKMFTTLGAEAADRWLMALGLPMLPRWHVEIAVLADGDSRFDLDLYAEEWGFRFDHAGRVSWIRVTDVPFVHGRDDFRLLAKTPDLLGINALLCDLEVDHGIAFRRATASVRTNVPNADGIVRDWLLQPLPLSTIKKTVEFCGNEMHGGVRCTLSRGHDGDHQYHGHDGTGQLRWK
jgi:hypothetical protein